MEKHKACELHTVIELH